MTYSPTGENLTADAWQKGVIGIWYGAWTPADLAATTHRSPTDAAKSLSRLPNQKKLDWGLSSKHVDVIRRFSEIKANDWVFTYFDQSLHLGQVVSKAISEVTSLWRAGEPFKARKIKNCKSFSLDSLPESFRLLSSAGRGTLHQVGATRVLVEMLAKAKSSAEVTLAYRQLDWREWLEALGPKGWETLCLGYLIEQEDFLPTGVGIGGTLADFDIVGRARSGTRILAQCKKSPTTHLVSPEERETYIQTKHSKVYLFAYNGASGSPDHVSVVTGDDIQRWFKKESVGRRYLKLLTS